MLDLYRWHDRVIYWNEKNAVMVDLDSNGSPWQSKDLSVRVVVDFILWMCLFASLICSR